MFWPGWAEKEPAEVNIEFLAKDPHKFNIYHPISDPMLKSASAYFIFIGKFLQIFITMLKDHFVKSEAYFFPAFLS